MYNFISFVADIPYRKWVGGAYAIFKNSLFIMKKYKLNFKNLTNNGQQQRTYVYVFRISLVRVHLK